MLNVSYKKIHPDAITPEYHTSGAAAFDFGLIEDVSIEPGAIVKVPTGLVIQTPEHHVLLIASRSSNPLKKGIDLANSIGIIDSDYSGPNDEIQLLIMNISKERVELKKGDRVAQGLFAPVPRAQFVEVAELVAPSRGGFGSTGR